MLKFRLNGELKKTEQHVGVFQKKQHLLVGVVLSPYIYLYYFESKIDQNL